MFTIHYIVHFFTRNDKESNQSLNRGTRAFKKVRAVFMDSLEMQQ